MKIFSWGANSYGQLSHGIESEQSIVPLETKFDNDEVHKTVSIVGGGGHTLLLNKVGKVYGCGWNNNGQLTSTTDKNLSLTKISSLESINITQIACGWDSSYAITEEGSVLVWGSNKHGQLGIPREKASIVTKPVKLNLNGVVQIAAGLRHAAVVTKEGFVLVCGKGPKGQLGLVEDNSCPVLNTEVFRKVNGIKNVKQVACGQQYTTAITADNQVYVWGDNKHGQIGLDPDLHPCEWTPQLLPLSHLSPLHPDVVAHAGWTHCALLSVTGDVVSWGWNEHGNCGCGSIDNVATPTSVKLPGTCILIGAGSGHSFAVIK